MGRSGSRAAPGSHDHRSDAPNLARQPARAARTGRTGRRAQGASGHDRRPPRAARARVRRPTAIRRQRLARATHPARDDANVARRRVRQARTDSGRAPRARRQATRGTRPGRSAARELPPARPRRARLAARAHDRLAAGPREGCTRSAPGCDPRRLSRGRPDPCRGARSRKRSAARAHGWQPPRQRDPPQPGTRLDSDRDGGRSRSRAAACRERRPAPRPRRHRGACAAIERTASGNGSVGLGLSIVAAIADAHGGNLRLDARTDGGLRISIELPGATAPAVARETV
jgi:hypothetical protein